MLYYNFYIFYEFQSIVNHILYFYEIIRTEIHISYISYIIIDIDSSLKKTPVVFIKKKYSRFNKTKIAHVKITRSTIFIDGR